jgi:hypothetical protein
MKRLFTLMLGAALTITVFGQHSSTPAAYLHALKSERAKVEVRTIHYYKSSLTEENHLKINVRFNQVLSQLQESRKKLAEKEAFRNDESLKAKYLQTFDSLYFIFNTSFKHAEQIKLYSGRDEAGLEHYYQALAAAERNMQATIQAFDKAENLFKTSYNTQIDRHQETDVKFELLVKVSTYNRMSMQCFRRVDITMNRYFDILDSVSAPGQKSDRLQLAYEHLQQALKTSKEEFALLEKNDLNRNLISDLRSYLKSAEKQVNKRLASYNYAIQTKDYQKATYAETKLDFHYFNLDYQIMRKSFLKARNNWITSSFELLEDETPQELLLMASAL